MSSIRERNETGTAADPDLIVGIDLGTTFTGVSYCIPTPGGLDPPPVINKWPGLEGNIANKVPTMLSAGIGVGEAWGYQTLRLRAVGDNQSVVIQDHFKLLLDKRQLARLNRAFVKGGRPELEKAMVARWFKAYLQQLYEWITQEIGEIFKKKLEDMKVDFLFSVPTMWDQETKGDYLEIIKEAGFGSVKSQMHIPKISLNEAEAAAIFVALCHPKEKEHEFKKNNVILICDAGGGTTDVSALKVVDFEGVTPIFEQQRRVKGIPIGSINIDEQYDDSIGARLGKMDSKMPHPSSEENFQVIKTSLGEEIADGVKGFRIPIPGLDKGFSNPETGVSEGRVDVSRRTIEGFFDRLLSGDSGSGSVDDPGSDSDETDKGPTAVSKGIYGLVDKQIGKLAGRVDYLVLSGGLGSSKYIQRRLRERYGPKGVSPKRIDPKGVSPQKIEIVIAEDPQLVVCRGLVMNRLRQLYKLKPIIRKRGCPASYGVVWNMPFDKNLHAELKHEAIKMKPDGRLYLPDRIQWFIKRNDLLDCESVQEFPFTRSVRYKNATTLKHNIVRFDQRTADLPEKLDLKTVRSVCMLAGALGNGKELQRVEGVRKEHRIPIPIFGGGFRKYLQVEYKVQVRVKDGGLKFNIFFNEEDLGGPGEVDTEWNAELGGFEAQPWDSGSEKGE